MYMHINVHACTSMYIYVDRCIQIPMYVYVHICTYMYISVHICTYMYKYVHICTYLYIHVHICAYTYMYVFLHSVTLSDMALPSRPLLVQTFASWTVKLWLLVQVFVRSLLYFHISPSFHIAISRRCLRGLRLLPLLFNDAYMDLGMRLPWIHFLPIFCCTVPYQKVFQQRAERA